jgi:hypothetical protein
MKTPLFILLPIVLVVSLAHDGGAQTYAFKVIASKGQTEVKSEGGEWVPVKVFSSLLVNDEVRLPVNGYLGLNHVTGKPLEVKNPGVYKISDLASQVGKGPTAMNKYTDFILSSDQEKKNKLAATGAVHRGDNSPIQVFLPGPGKADLLSNYFSLNWASEGSPKYTVILMDMSDEELKRIDVSEKNLIINFDELNITETQVLIKISAQSGQSSEKFVVKRLSGTQKKKAQDSTDELGLSSEKNALEKYMLANVYEEKGLLIDALTSYKSAADLEPEVEFYKEAYQQFLVRLGFK